MAMKQVFTVMHFCRFAVLSVCREVIVRFGMILWSAALPDEVFRRDMARWGAILRGSGRDAPNN